MFSSKVMTLAPALALGQTHKIGLALHLSSSAQQSILFIACLLDGGETHYWPDTSYRKCWLPAESSSISIGYFCAFGGSFHA